MVTEYQNIRESLEVDGYRIGDDAYGKAVDYARRKAEASGKDESYLPYLLPDVIREWVTRQCINLYSITLMELQKSF